MVGDADQEERKLHESYSLPADYLLERMTKDHLNLPLLAFSYLLRRLTVRTSVHGLWGLIRPDFTPAMRKTLLDLLQ